MAAVVQAAVAYSVWVPRGGGGGGDATLHRRVRVFTSRLPCAFEPAELFTDVDVAAVLYLMMHQVWPRCALRVAWSCRRMWTAHICCHGRCHWPCLVSALSLQFFEGRDGVDADADSQRGVLEEWLGRLLHRYRRCLGGADSGGSLRSVVTPAGDLAFGPLRHTQLLQRVHGLLVNVVGGDGDGAAAARRLRWHALR